jgi:hypothetical protein
MINIYIVAGAAGLGLLLLKPKNRNSTSGGGTNYTPPNTNSSSNTNTSGGGTNYTPPNTNSSSNTNTSGGGTNYTPPNVPYSYRNSYWTQNGCNVWQLQIGVPIKRANRCTVSFLQALLGSPTANIANLIKFDGIWDAETFRVMKVLFAEDPRYATPAAQATLENKTAQELFQIIQTSSAGTASRLNRIRARLYQVTTPTSVSYNFQP